MELAQLEQMVRWLDEERKKDKATITALQERLEQQSLLMDAQSRELEQLRQEAALLQAGLNRTEEYPAMIEKTQRDITGNFEAFREQLRREKTDADHLRQAEIETLNQELSEIDKRLRGLPRIEERLEAREAETEGRNRPVGNPNTTLISRSAATGIGRLPRHACAAALNFGGRSCRAR